MTRWKSLIRKTGRMLWRLLYHCALVAGIVGAAGLLDLGWRQTARVFNLPLPWLLTAMLAAGIVWGAVDAARRRRAK